MGACNLWNVKDTGKKVDFQGDSETTLLKYLRGVACLKSPKDGCSGQAACGCCMVEVDGKGKLPVQWPVYWDRAYLDQYDKFVAALAGLNGLRALPGYEHVPIVMVTVQDDKKIRYAALDGSFETTFKDTSGTPSAHLFFFGWQGDVLFAALNSHGDTKHVVLLPASVSECFDMAIESWRIALKYMTPVAFMSDAFLANGYTKEEWKVVTESRKILHLPELRVSCTMARR